jgi:hypothetical protein
LKFGFQKKVCTSKSPTFFSRKPLGASNDDHNMTRQMNFKPTSDQPLANAYFGTFAFLPMRQPTANKNAKEPKFSCRTSNAKVLSTSSLLNYRLVTTTLNKPNT